MIVLTILNTLIPAAAIALVAWAAMWLLRVNAATRYWVWWSVLAIIFVPWLRPGPVPVAASAPVTLPAAPTEQGVNWIVWALVAWAAFAMYRAARIVWSYAKLRSLKRAARPAEDTVRFEHWRASCRISRPVALLVSDRIQLPMAVGFLRPAVILPDHLALNAEEMDHVLLHELAHVARRDDWANLVARVAGVVLGLHPVAAFALARIEREREMACDDWVVAATGEARSYAESLTRLFEMARGQQQPVLASGVMGSRLGDRVERLLARNRRFERGASSIRLTAVIAVLLSIGFVGLHLPGWVAYAQEPAKATPSAKPGPQTAPTDKPTSEPGTPMNQEEALRRTLQFLEEQLRESQRELRSKQENLRRIESKVAAVQKALVELEQEKR
jgi:beta-lactamase regulating signal transducer with metallopeptidase domain